MSLHHDALLTLEGWRAPTEEQERLRRRYVEHLRAHPDGTDRECRPHHLTASTLVLDAAGTQALLTLHAKARRWFQVGGHCEATDVTLAGAALREATEESGVAGLMLDPVPVQLSEHEVPFCGARDDARPVHHLDVRFVALAPPGALLTTSAESLDLRWWPTDTLPQPEADLVELVALAQARIGVGQSTSPITSPGGGSSRAPADQPIR